MSQSIADSETKEINGVTYRVGHLDPLVCQSMTIDLVQLVSPAFASIGSVVAGSDVNLEDVLDGNFDGIMGEEFSKALETSILGTIGGLSKSMQAHFINTLSEVSWVIEGDKEPNLARIYSTHFRGRVGDAYLWLAFAIRVNFKGFFSILKLATNQ